MEPWLEYAEEVQYWDDVVDGDPCPETYLRRWQARINHTSWQEKRDYMLWLCDGKCERCGVRVPPKELQLHHLHYDTLWYESFQDLQLLCPPCHYEADQERAEEQARKNRGASIVERAHRYKEIANRGSGQENWPVSYEQALRRIMDIEENDYF